VQNILDRKDAHRQHPRAFLLLSRVFLYLHVRVF